MVLAGEFSFRVLRTRWLLKRRHEALEIAILVNRLTIFVSLCSFEPIGWLQIDRRLLNHLHDDGDPM